MIIRFTAQNEKSDIMNDWWKSQILQGEDNDYGQYDYLIEELPKDECGWKYGLCKCSSCGKEKYLTFYSIHYFHTLDGWDSMDCSDCWGCMLQDKLHSIKRKTNLKIKAFKMATELYKDGNKDFGHYYKLAKKIVR